MSTFGVSVALVLLGAALVAASLGDNTLATVGVLVAVLGVLLSVVNMLFEDRGAGGRSPRP